MGSLFVRPPPPTSSHYFFPSFQSPLIESVWWRYEDQSYRETPKQSFSTLSRVKSILPKWKWGTTREWTAGAPEVGNKRHRAREERGRGCYKPRNMFQPVETALSAHWPHSSPPPTHTHTRPPSPSCLPPALKMLINRPLQIESNLSKEHRMIKLICPSREQS